MSAISSQLPSQSAALSTPTSTGLSWWQTISNTIGSLFSTTPDQRDPALQAKDGSLYRCIRRSEAAQGGHIYTFQLRNRYKKESALEAARDKIFPADENSSFINEIFFQTQYKASCASGVDSFLKSLFPFQDVIYYTQTTLSQLGYRYREEQDEIDLPDLQALTAGMQGNSRFASFSIVSSAGVATDEEFVNAHITHDGILSEGAEFVHDHLIHLVSTIEFAVAQPVLYAKFRQEFQHLVNNKKRTIETIKDPNIQKAAKLVLSIYVDALTATNGASRNNPIKLDVQNPKWKAYAINQRKIAWKDIETAQDLLNNSQCE